MVPIPARAVVISRSMDILDFRQSSAESVGMPRKLSPDMAWNPRPGVGLAVHSGCWPGGLPLTVRRRTVRWVGDLGMKDRGPWSCATSAAAGKRPDGE